MCLVFTTIVEKVRMNCNSDNTGRRVFITTFNLENAYDKECKEHFENAVLNWGFGCDKSQGSITKIWAKHLRRIPFSGELPFENGHSTKKFSFSTSIL